MQIKAYGYLGDTVLISHLSNTGTDLLRANLLVGNYLALKITPHIPTPTGVHAT